MTDIKKVLNERGNRYGEYNRHADITQELKKVVARHLSILDKELHARSIRYVIS